MVNLDKKTEEDIKEKVEAYKEASNLDEDVVMVEVPESIYPEEPIYDEDGDELIDLDILPQQKGKKLYNEPIGPQEPFMDDYEKARKEIGDFINWKELKNVNIKKGKK